MTTIDMRKNNGGEWEPKGIVSDEKPDAEKKAALRFVLYAFVGGYTPIVTALEYKDRRAKMIAEGLLKPEEIDGPAKPFLIQNLKKLLTDSAYASCLRQLEEWVGMGVLTKLDRAEFVNLPEVRKVALAEVKSIINHAWMSRNYFGYPEHYNSSVWSYVLDGTVSHEEAQTMWDETKKLANKTTEYS